MPLWTDFSAVLSLNLMEGVSHPGMFNWWFLFRSGETSVACNPKGHVSVLITLMSKNHSLTSQETFFKNYLSEQKSSHTHLSSCEFICPACGGNVHLSWWHWGTTWQPLGGGESCSDRTTHLSGGRCIDSYEGHLKHSPSSSSVTACHKKELIRFIINFFSRMHQFWVWMIDAKLLLIILQLKVIDNPPEWYNWLTMEGLSFILGWGFNSNMTSKCSALLFGKVPDVKRTWKLTWHKGNFFFFFFASSWIFMDSFTVDAGLSQLQP